MQLLILVLLPFIGCFVAALMPSSARNRESWFAGLIGILGIANAISMFGLISAGDVLRIQFDWLPAQDLNIIFRMDGLAWLFTLMIQGIFLLVVLYARYYMSPKDPVPRFFAFLMAFMGAMQGVVISGNLIQLIMFWELTSICSFLLIGYWHHRPDARRGARMAFTITGFGGLALLAGVLVLGHIVGSYDLDEVLAAGDTVRNHDWYLPCLILIALGALTKSAQFPFHFWLPHAMAAPTPVSSYLHSATMVKAGIFLMMRLWPVLAGTQEWTWIIGGAGVCTMLIGSFIAIFQHDLKGLLAYSTISHLGLITVLLAMGTPLAMVAAIFHTLNHATFKASLFMAAGIIDHETGTRDMRVLRGLFHSMPITSTLAIVASGAMAGVPLLNGFISKEMFFAEALTVGSSNNWWMPAAAVAMGIFGVAYSLRLVHIFIGKPATDLPNTPHEPPHWMRFPVEFLVMCCLVVGIIPAYSISVLLNAAAVSVLGTQTPAYSLSIWHGFNIPLLMSFIALAGGIALYWVLRTRYNLLQINKVPLLHHFNGKQVYESAMLGLATTSGKIEKIFGTRRLQPQIFMMICAGIMATILVIPHLPYMWELVRNHYSLDFPFSMLWLLGCSCALAAAWQAKYHRLAALILVGGTGVATSITFFWLSAPDLALTQIMVETVTTILILLGLRWLPARISARKLNIKATFSDRARRFRDLSIAIIAGLGMALISYLVLLHPAQPGIGPFFIERALSEGGGTNVVNVLLVDFRGFDTFGEITVLSIVALTVYALLRRFRPAPESVAIPAQQANAVDHATLQTPAEQASQGYLMVPGVFLRLLLPIISLVAVYFFMRGHNVPGGGFVAGLIFSTAIIIQYMVAGTVWVETQLHIQPHRWIAVGLITAAITGLGALVLGYPFLTSHTAHLHLPILGEIHAPSAFMFDLGVFCVVVGSTMLILVSLAHQSLRSHRAVEAGKLAASREIL